MSPGSYSVDLYSVEREMNIPWNHVWKRYKYVAQERTDRNEMQVGTLKNDMFLVYFYFWLLISCFWLCIFEIMIEESCVCMYVCMCVCVWCVCVVCVVCVWCVWCVCVCVCVCVLLCYIYAIFIYCVYIIIFCM